MSITDPMIGRKLGDYTVQEILGQGGMARVYKGYDDKLDRYAAVKVIDAHLISRETETEYRERFRREARAIARLNHTNIVKIYQFGEEGSLYYMAMEYVSGLDLRQIIKEFTSKGETMPYEKVMRVMNDITAALDYAHKEGVIHRDVKPSNIMVTPGGQSILMDFGLALSVPEGTLGSTFGSVHYIAPEQAVSSARAVPQSDLYSLGIVLYEMLTGRVPFDDQSTMSVALKHLSDPPPAPSSLNPNVLPQIEEVVLKTLDKEPRKRFATGQEFARALEFAFGFNVPITLDEKWGSSGSRPDYVFPKPPSTPTKPTSDSIGLSTTNRIKPVVGTMDDSPTISEAARPSRAFASTTSAKPPTVVAPEPEEPRNRLLVIGGAALAAVAMGIFILFAILSSQNNGDVTPTAPVVAVVTETEEVTAEVAAVASATPRVTATDEDTETPEATNTRRATATQEDTETPEATNTRRASTSASATPRATTVIAVVPTTEASATPSPTTSPTATPDNAAVMLYYDHRTFVLVNRSDETIDISDLYFIHTNEAEQEFVFESNNWTNDATLNSFNEGDCLQVWTSDFNFLDEDASVCPSREGWRQLNGPRLFWISSEADAVFEVRRGSQLLATCPASPRSRTADFEFSCAVDVAAER